ncbi:MAG: hypothetical protein ACNA7M_11235 [Roseovarius sp.]
MRGVITLVLCALPVMTPAQSAPSERIEEFIAYMKPSGCRLSRAEADSQLTAVGFTTKELRPVIGKMLQEGEAVMHTADDSLSLSEKVCSQ